MGVRLFKVESEGAFKEYMPTDFELEHQESVLETWLENNPEKILEDGALLLIGRQVLTNLGGYIDLLGIDRSGDTVAMELKRGRTPRETLAQVLEYASFAEMLTAEQLNTVFASYMKEDGTDLASYHNEYFGLGTQDAVVFNQNQRLVIVGQRITPEIQQTSRFLRKKGIRVTCLEFSFFRTDSGEMMMSVTPVVGSEPEGSRSVRSGPSTLITEAQFLGSADDLGRPVFTRILDFAKENTLPVHWGTKGLSINVRLDDTDVPVCFAYPPHAKHGQCIKVDLRGAGGLLSKVAHPDDAERAIAEAVQATNLFEPRQRGWRCGLTRRLNEEETKRLLSWLLQMAKIVHAHGLRADEELDS